MYLNQKLGIGGFATATDALYIASGAGNLTVMSSVGIGTNNAGSYKLNCQGGPILMNVGRGEVYWENNSSYDINNGEGITLRTKTNPTDTGTATDSHIFAVRSSGYAARLFVGQLLTSTGYNNYFGVGFNVTTAFTEGNTSDYEYLVDCVNKKIVLGGNNCIDWNTSNTLKIGSGVTKTEFVGNVGIGTASPDTHLHIHSSSAAFPATLKLSSHFIFNEQNTPLVELHRCDASGTLQQKFSTWIQYNAGQYDTHFDMENSGRYIFGADGLLLEVGTNKIQCYSDTYIKNLWCTGTFTNTSDKRLKTNIERIENYECLDKISKLSPVRYEKLETKKQEIGFLADDVLPIIPEVVQKCDLKINETEILKDCLGISYTELIPFLVGSIQELHKKIEVLEAKVFNKQEK